MKTDRLIGILSILLQEEKTTAPELAEKFEVSRRTINRDIEDLCKAGIPIRTAQGTGGGISIMDGYRMDRTILTSKDMQMILAGLRSLDSVSGNRYYGQLMEKIQTGSSEFISERDSMLIDLSSWYKGSLVPKIEVIQNAIENRHTIQFKYYAPSGDSNRRIEPYYLVFRWSSWYVWGWCLEREDYRLFKLNRMDCVTESEQFFMCRNVPMPNLSNEKIFPGGIKVKVLFAPDVKWRLVEEFGPHCFTRTDDGRLLFSADYTDMENLVTWLMTFGAKTYGEIPLWVLANVLTFGNLSKMFRVFPQSLKSKVSKNFEPLNQHQMEQFLSVLTKYRNVCAHGERLFTYRTVDAIADTPLHKKLSLPQSGNQYEKGKQDLFAVVIAFRYILPGKDFLEFKRKLIKEIDRVNREVEHISEVELLNKMGFSENWKSITKYHLK